MIYIFYHYIHLMDVIYVVLGLWDLRQEGFYE